jgi:hypothetical protein
MVHVEITWYRQRINCQWLHYTVIITWRSLNIMAYFQHQHSKYNGSNIRNSWGYSQTSILLLRASILRGLLLYYTRIFFRKLVPPTISYVWALVDTVSEICYCENVLLWWVNGMMKYLAIESLSISSNLDEYHYHLLITELWSEAKTI